MYKILFKGDPFLFIGDTPSDGAIATEEQFENFLPSYAHLFPDGTVKRYNVVIGTRDDIQFLEKL